MDIKNIKDVVRYHLREYKEKRQIRFCRKKALPDNEKKVLFWHHGGYIQLCKMESYFALALELRGYKPHFILCDGVAPACAFRVEENIDVDFWGKNCAACQQKHANILERMGFSYTLLSDFLASYDLKKIYSEMPTTIEEAKKFSYAGQDLSDVLISGLIRFYKSATFSIMKPVHIKEFAYDAVCNLLASNIIFKELQPESLFMLQCAYTDYGPAYKSALANGVHVFCYQSAHQANKMTFFSLDKKSLGVGPTLKDAAWASIASETWTERNVEIVERFYDERYRREIDKFNDIAGLLPEAQANKNALVEYYNIDVSKPIAIFFSQLRWDVSCEYTGLIFESYDEFLLESVKVMLDKPDIEWLIKIHPVERKEAPAARTIELLRKHYPELPSHIKIIPYDSPFSPLDFFELVDVAITAGGTSGLEVAALGKPVVTAGRFLYTCRGFTYDSPDVKHFLSRLNTIETLAPLSSQQRELAQKYLLVYIYRQPIPIYPLSSGDWHHPIKKIEDISLLLPGKSKYIDLIMDAFKEKTDALLPLEWL